MKSVMTIMIGVILFASMVVIPTIKDLEDEKMYKEIKSPLVPDAIVLSSIIQAECGNCSQSEKYLVGSVVLNRVKSPLWPNTIDSVLQEPNQFHGRYTNNYHPGMDSDKIANDLLMGLYVTPDIYYFCLKNVVNPPMNSIIIEADFHIFGK